MDISFSKKFDTNWVGEPGAHTSHFVTADCSGLAVSLTQTIGPVFGAKAATPNLGFAYAATMGGYLRTGPQIPGERPRTAIAPVFVTKNNKIIQLLIKIPHKIYVLFSKITSFQFNNISIYRLPISVDTINKETTDNYVGLYSTLGIFERLIDEQMNDIYNFMSFNITKASYLYREYSYNIFKNRIVKLKVCSIDDKGFSCEPADYLLDSYGYIKRRYKIITA